MTADDNERGWFKSSYSGPNNNSCVEARLTCDGIDVRDSKDSDGPILRFDRPAWARFLQRLA